MTGPGGRAGDGVDWKLAYEYLEEQQALALTRLAVLFTAYESAAEAAYAPQLRTLEAFTEDGSTLVAVLEADGRTLEYGFYVYEGDMIVKRQDYGPSNTLRWSPGRGGSFRVRGFLRVAGEREPVATATTAPIVISRRRR